MPWIIVAKKVTHAANTVHVSGIVLQEKREDKNECDKQKN
jgi:hypothetical protein